MPTAELDVQLDCGGMCSSVNLACTNAGRPTQKPSKKPSRKATEKPTRKPSKKPSKIPTNSPTKAPTSAPTSGTAGPTAAPTGSATTATFVGAGSGATVTDAPSSVPAGSGEAQPGSKLTLQSGSAAGTTVRTTGVTSSDSGLQITGAAAQLQVGLTL